MSLMRRLYERFRQLIHEGAKFLVVGGLGLVVTNVVYGLLRHVSVGPVTSTTVATIVAVVVTYLGNRYWSFRHRERTGMAREGIIFLILNGVGLLIQDAVVGFNYYLLGLGHDRVAQFAALNFGIALATLFRFWSYRKWVWAAPAQDALAGPVATAQAGGNGSAPAGQEGAGTATGPLAPFNGNGDGHRAGANLPSRNGYRRAAAQEHEERPAPRR